MIRRRRAAPWWLAFADAYDSAGALFGVPVIPVGRAFARFDSIHPEISLYASDRHHANDTGAYLRGLVFYSCLSGCLSTVGLPANWINWDGSAKSVDPTAAGYMQEIADAICAEFFCSGTVASRSPRHTPNTPGALRICQARDGVRIELVENEYAGITLSLLSGRTFYRRRICGPTLLGPSDELKPGTYILRVHSSDVSTARRVSIPPR